MTMMKRLAARIKLDRVGFALLPLLAMVTVSGCVGVSPPVNEVSNIPRPTRAMGVCPPFPLRDEQGNIINPVQGINATVPYSPKQTCGASGCHNYDLITQGFHFQQGKDESPPPEYAERYQWISHPGNYGGNWCSPAPLYRSLAPKKNSSARTIDMTSFEFVTATCGNCHAGGGPMEYDREGHRYDDYMREQGMVSGGENGLDGDYYRARWIETGVIETDCNLCHVPEYNYKERNEQLAKLNFRWAATSGAGLGTVSGSVQAGDSPMVEYDLSRFDQDGNVIIHLAPEPRNQACLNCHFKPDWKKRGAAFSERTDVHMQAGLRCVDCHAGGSKAADPRIREREAHQFGKGDDPSGFVRNDLDNTVRSCENCHLEGWRNAPIATHEWLPPLHMDKLSCQACHIPVRAVKSALVQASDIYNPAPRISPPAKHIWAFYDQEMEFWNHYGELDLFTAADEPTNISRPTLVRYKGKIYPVNRVHSAWVGFEEQGKPGLNQVFMKDFYLMWVEHRKDPARNYPALAAITDDNGDALIEVNRPQEIDSLLRAVHQYLKTTAFPLENRRLVWVSDDRAYYSSREWRLLPRQSHEATPYASVYKFSHDVAPARAALGVRGCTDCHSSNGAFFNEAVLEIPFASENAAPRWVPNYRILGISAFSVGMSMVREQWFKPILYLALGLLIVVAAIHGLRWYALKHRIVTERGYRRWLILALLLAAGIDIIFSPNLLDYTVARRFTLDSHHFAISVVALIAGLLVAIRRQGERWRGGAVERSLTHALWVLIVASCVFGGLMLLRVEAWNSLTRLAYTLFDVAILVVVLLAVVTLLTRLVHRPGAMPLET